MGRIFDAYYPQHTNVGYNFGKVRSTVAESPRRNPFSILKRTVAPIIGRSTLHEGQETKAYSDIWLEAMTYLNDRRGQVSDLPNDSPEKLLVDALQGALYQFEIKDEEVDNGALRTKISGLAARLDELIGAESQGSELGAYVGQLNHGLRTLINQIDPATIEDGGEEDEGDKPKPKAEPVEGEDTYEPDAEEPKSSRDEPSPPPPPESDDLAKSLGVAAESAINMVRRNRSNLMEFYSTVGAQDKPDRPPHKPGDPYQPGDPVFRLVDGQLVQFQVVTDADGKVTVIDPKNPDKSDTINRDELASQDQEGQKPEIKPTGTDPKAAAAAV